MKITRRLAILFLIVLTLFHIVNNYIILKQDTVPIRNTPVVHYLDSLKIHSMKFTDRLILQEIDYPPLFYYSSLPVYAFFNTNQDTAAMTNTFYLIILIFSIYGIGKYLHSELTGLLSAFIVSTFIAVFGFSRIYMLEFALTAMVSLCIFFLLKADGFSNRVYSILFGILCGLGMLIKWNFSIFIIGPMLLVLFKEIILPSIRKKSKKSIIKKKVLNMLIAFIFFNVIISIWYPFNLDKVFQRANIFYGTYDISNEEYRYYIRPEFRADMSLGLNISVVMFYIQQLYTHQIGYFYGLLFFLSFIYILFLSKNRNLMLPIGIIFPYIILTDVLASSSLGEQRFIMPYLPFIAVIIGLFISNLKNVIIRKAAIMVILVIGFYQFFALSYGTNMPFLNKDLFDTGQRYVYGFMKSDSDHWKDREITQTIVDLAENISSKKVTISLFQDSGIYDIRDLDLNIELYYKEELEKNHKELNVFHPLGLCGIGSCIVSEYSYIDMIQKSHIVITDNQTSNMASQKPVDKVVYLMKKVFNDNLPFFDLIKQFELPNNNTIYIYKRK